MPMPKHFPPIDPVLQKILDENPGNLATGDGIEVARSRLRKNGSTEVRPELRAVRTEDRQIDGPAGPIPIRVYRPDDVGAGTPPVTMYFHGGGFCVGDLDSYDSRGRLHAVGGQTVVVSVQYRLAPEHPFPAGVDDVWAATRWVAANADALGVDASRFAVSGDSAGGALAAVVAQMARDNGGPNLTFQLLWYPVILWDFTLPSYRENANGPVITPADLSRFLHWYLGDADITNPSARMAPGRAVDLSRLPKSYIAVGGHDPLRDDGLRYAQMLADGGNDVQLHAAPTLTHAFLAYYGAVPAVTDVADLGLAALRRALHRK